MQQFVTAAFGLIGFDIVTGILAAFAHHEMSSGAAREGLWHKVGFSALILFSVYLSRIAPALMGTDIYVPSTEIVCGIICYIEIESNLENICRLLPDAIAIRILELFHLNSDKFYYLDYIEEPDEELAEIARDLD